MTDGAGTASLGKRLFTRRLDLIVTLDGQQPAQADALPVARETALAYGDPATDRELRSTIADRLHEEVAAMNLDNFVVRPKRRLVERYAKPESWVVVSPAAAQELAQEVAGLPAELQSEVEEAKRFDLLLLNVQLARSVMNQRSSAYATR